MAFLYATPQIPIGAPLPSPQRERWRRRVPQATTQRGPAPAQTPLPEPPAPLSQMPIAVGTWGWGNRLLYSYSPTQDAELEETFHAAVEAGVTLFDTADSYGTGSLNARAETLLGRFLVDATRPVHIATKFASYPWRTRRGIVNAAEASCERIGRVVDLGQMHWSPRGYQPFQEGALVSGLADAVEAGYVREVGISNVGPIGLSRISQELASRGVRLRSAQSQLSLVCRTPITSGLLESAAEKEVSVLGYSPLALGFLAGQTPPGLRGLLFRTLRNDALRDSMMRVAERREATPAQVAVAWALRQDVTVILGCRTTRHVRDGVAATRVCLSDDDVAELENTAAQGSQMVRNAFETR